MESENFDDYEQTGLSNVYFGNLPEFTLNENVIKPLCKLGKKYWLTLTLTATSGFIFGFICYEVSRNNVSNKELLNIVLNKVVNIDRRIKLMDQKLNEYVF